MADIAQLSPRIRPLEVRKSWPSEKVAVLLNGDAGRRPACAFVGSHPSRVGLPARTFTIQNLTKNVRRLAADLPTLGEWGPFFMYKTR